MSLRLKLFLPILLLALGLALYITQWWYPGALGFHARFHQEMLEKQLDSIGAGLAPLMQSGRTDEIRDLLGELKRKNPDWQRLELFNEQGERIYPAVQHPGSGSHAHPGAATLRHEIAVGGRTLGRILLDVDHETMFREIERSQRGILEALVVALMLFVVALGFVVETLVRRPLGQLAKALAALSGGDFSHALPPARNDEVGKLIGSFAAMRASFEHEIAVRRKAEEESSLANARFKFLVEQSLVGFYILQDGMVAYANPYLLERIGGNAGSVGMPVRDWIYPDDWPLVEENIRKRMAGEVARTQYSFRLLARDGSPVEVDSFGMVTEYNGKPAIIGVMLDLTEKKHAELALKKSEAFLRTIFDTAGEGIWVIDTFMLTVKTNRALLDMLEISEYDMIYKSIYDFADEENKAIFRFYIAKSQAEGISQHFEIVLMCTDGRKICCQFNISPFYDEYGEILGVFALVSDITERKNADLALKQLSEDLERRVQEEAAKNREKDHLLIQQSRMAAMGEMIGNIAHQWRQPLNALGLMLANIKDAWQYNELTGDYLIETTTKGGQLVQKMSATIDDFRNFFKPNRDKMAFSPYQAIVDALSIVETSLGNNNIAVRLEIKKDAMALGFPNEYSQVLLNLIGNAKEILLERSVDPGWIRIRLAEEGGMVKVTVADNGGGVPKEIMTRVFDPYFTTRAKGTGIGLYMSKMIIENNMNGEIRVCNTKDGAEFEIAVPMVENRGNE